jgi:hypothetical protein
MCEIYMHKTNVLEALVCSSKDNGRTGLVRVGDPCLGPIQDPFISL